MINYLSFLNEYCFYLVSLKFDSKFNGLMVKIIFWNGDLWVKI